MITRTFRGLIRLFGGLGAGLAILLVLLAWRLSTGPISLTFLSPHVERALSAGDGSFGVRLDETILTWAGWERALDVRVLNVRAVDAGGAAVAVVPELSLSLSVRGLLEGKLALKSVEFHRPAIQVLRREDGSFQIGFGEGGGGSDVLSTRSLDSLLARGESDERVRYLSRVDIHDAELMIVDRKLNGFWRAPASEIELRRNDFGWEGEVSLGLEIDGRTAGLTVLGVYQADGRHLDLGIEVDQVVPASLAGLEGGLSPLAALDLPFAGKLVMSVSLDGDVEALDFDFSGGRGHLRPEGEFEQSIPVTSAQISGQYDGSARQAEFERIEFEFEDDATLLLPKAGGHRLPLRSMAATAIVSVGDRRVQVSTLEADLGGPSILSQVTLTGWGDDLDIEFQGALQNLSVDEIERYWPRAWGDDPHDWVVANLSDGAIREARVDLRMRANSGEYVIDRLTGTMDLRGFTVDYLSPMPKVRNADGQVTFDQETFKIEIARGKSKGLSIREGTLLFTDLDKHDQWLTVDMVIDGPFRDALELVDHEPLGFASAIGVRPDHADGTSATRLYLHFILIDELTFEKVDVAASARIQNASLTGALFGRDIREGDLELRVDKNAMEVRGDVTLATIPGILEWQEYFDEGGPYRSRYVLKGTINDEQLMTQLGVDFPPFSPEFMAGDIDAELVWTVQRDGNGVMEAELDLSRASLSFPTLGWQKDPGVAGQATVKIGLDGKQVLDIPGFAVAAGDLSVLGSAAFQHDGSGLARIDFERLAFGRTRVQGAVIPGGDGGWTVTLHGRSLDLSPIFEEMSETASSDQEDSGSAGPDVSFSVDLDEVWVAPDQSIRGVEGSLVRGNGEWRTVNLEGLVGDEKTITVRMEPVADERRELSVLAEDAGASLRTFGYYENMVGGRLELSGTIDDRAEGSPLDGHLRISDFRVVNAPILAHVVGVLALTGIGDALQGQGLSFSLFEMPFTRHEGVLTVTDARAGGASLGFTASGTIDAHKDVLEIEGTLVPAYAINSALGRLPVVGQIFSGGEKGGGIFAASYRISGPSEAPRMVVNPLAALAPGILRKLFGFLGPGQPTEELSGAPESPVDRADAP